MSVTSESIKDITAQDESAKKRHNSQMSDQATEVEAEYNNLEKTELIKRLKKFEEENKILKETVKSQALTISKTNETDSDVDASHTSEKKARKEGANRGKIVQKGTPVKEGTPVREATPTREGTPVKEGTPAREGTPGREEIPIPVPPGLLYTENETLPETERKINELIKLIEETPNKINTNIINALVKNIRQSKIKELDLKHKNITNKSVIAIAKSLRGNHSLIGLNFSHNLNITGVGAKKIAKALRKNTKLEQLDMSNNKITDEGVECFVQLIRGNKKLKFLHLEKNKFTLDGVRKLEKIYQASTLKYLFLIEESSEIEEIVQRTPKKGEVSESKTQAEMNDAIACEIKCIIERINEKMSKNSGDFPGRSIKNYREVRVTSMELGRGRFGVVYKGHFRQEAVAVKIISDTATIPQVEQAKNEALTISEFNHKNIVKCKGYYESPRFSIIMEYAPLGSLRDCLQKHRNLVNLNINRIALDLARGLQYMHKYENKRSEDVGQSMIGTLHRDLKAKNTLLFLKKENRVRAKLSDFGLSKIADKASRSVPNSLRGKSGSGLHRAPEIRGGKDLHGILLPAHRTTFEADVYSYGTILFELTSYPLPVPGFINKSTCPPSSPIGELMINCCELDARLRCRLDNVIEMLNSLKTEVADKKASADVPPTVAKESSISQGVDAPVKIQEEAPLGSPDSTTLPSYTAVMADEALRKKAQEDAALVKAQEEAPSGLPGSSSLLSYTAVEALGKKAPEDVAHGTTSNALR